MMIDRSQVFEKRLEKFRKAIDSYKDQQIKGINEKAAEQQLFQKTKIINQAKDKDQTFYQKKQKNLQSDLRISKSRKINQCRMSKMKLRHQFVQKIQQDIKHALTQKINDKAKYKQLLKELIIQGLVKMLEQNVQLKCLKKDLPLVKELVASCQRQFGQMCVVQTKIKVNETQNLTEKDLGGVLITSNNGRIVCNNTLAARLQYSVQKLLPEVRNLLFPKEESSQKVL